MRLGVVVGLAAEARIARRIGQVATGGGMPAGAEAAARRLVADGATALLSFGLAGGLDPALRAGKLLLPVEVLDDDTLYFTDPALIAGTPHGRLFAGAGVVVTAAEKAALWRRTGADGIDLESGAVARVAAERGLPFAVVRAVCDPAKRSLPPGAVLALDQSGAIGLWRVLGSVLRQPGQVGALLALGRDAARARGSLLRYAARAATDATMLRATASATRMPSTPADRIPPA